MSTVHTAPREWVTSETGLALQWSDSPPCLPYILREVIQKTRIFHIQADQYHKGWRYPCAHYGQNIDWKIICWFGLVCLSYLCYQIPQLCKSKCCEVSWNWLNCRVIMFCTPVLDYLTGGLPKQLLDKLVLNRCPKLILQVWKFVEKGGNNKTETKAGFLYLLGSREERVIKGFE